MVTIEELIEMDKELTELVNKHIKFVEPCQLCGFCCQNTSILVTIPEIIRILKKTGKDFDDIFEIMPNATGITIKTKEINGKPYCMFYEDGRCKIYYIRPFQCKTYPSIFVPFFDELPTYWKLERGMVFFRCQRDHHVKCRYRIKSMAFTKIMLKRYDFLNKNYELQTELILSGEIKNIHKKY